MGKVFKKAKKVVKKVVKVVKKVAPIVALALPFALPVLAPAIAGAGFSASMAGFGAVGKGLTAIANVAANASLAGSVITKAATSFLTSAGGQKASTASRVPVMGAANAAALALQEAEQDRLRRSQAVARSASIASALQSDEKPTLARRSLLGG